MLVKSMRAAGANQALEVPFPCVQMSLLSGDCP